MADIQDQSHQDKENSEYSLKQVKMRVISDGLFASGSGSRDRLAQVAVDTSESQGRSWKEGTDRKGYGWRFRFF